MPLGIIPFPFGKCRICQDKATGLHYGVATCEGCKGFFKRSTLRGSNYKCYFGGGCEITPKNRNRCKACRFKRCQEVGMALDAVRMGRIPKVEKEKVLEVFHQCGSDYNKLELSAEKTGDGSYDFKMNPAENILESDDQPCPITSSTVSRVALPDENANPCEENKGSKQSFFGETMELISNANHIGPDSNVMTNREVNLNNSITSQEKGDNKPSVKHDMDVHSMDKHRFSGGFHSNRNEMVNRPVSVFNSESHCARRVLPSSSFPVRQVSETITSHSSYSQANDDMFINRNQMKLFLHEQELLKMEGLVSENHQDGSQQDCALNLIKETSPKTICENSGIQWSAMPSSNSRVQQLQIPQETAMYMSDLQCSDMSNRKLIPETMTYGESEHPCSSELIRTDKPSNIKQAQTVSYPGDSYSIQDKFWSHDLDERELDRSWHQSKHDSVYSNSGTYKTDQKTQQDLDSGYMKYEEKINTVVAELNHETQNYVQGKTENQPSPMEGVLDSDISFKGTGSISSRSSSSSKFNQSVLKIFSEVITEPTARERLTDRLKQILSTKDKTYVDSVINVVRNELQNILSQLGSSTHIQQKPESPDWNINKKNDIAEMIESKKRTLKRFLNDIEDFSGEIRFGDGQESPGYRDGPEFSTNDVLDCSGQKTELSGSSGYQSGRQEEMEQWLVSLNLAKKILYRLKPEHRDKIRLFRKGMINLRIMTDSDEDVALVYDRIITSIPLLNERVLGFCEQVPNFSHLNKDDKGKLIKRAYYDIWMLTYSEYFQGRRSEMILSTGEIYSVEAMRKILNDTIVDTMLDFADQFNALQLSDLEVSILCAVRLTHTGELEIEERPTVLQLHTNMMNVLRYEVQRNHPCDHVQLINQILKLMPLLEEINRIQKTVIANFPMKFKKQS